MIQPTSKAVKKPQPGDEKLRFIKASDLPDYSNKPYSVPFRVSVVRFIDPELEMPGENIWATWVLEILPFQDDKRGFLCNAWPGDSRLVLGIKENTPSHEIIEEFSGDSWADGTMEGVELWLGVFPPTGTVHTPRVWPIRPDARWKARLEDYIAAWRDQCPNTQLAQSSSPVEQLNQKKNPTKKK